MQLKDFIKADHQFDLEDQIPMVSTGKMRLPQILLKTTTKKTSSQTLGTIGNVMAAKCSKNYLNLN